jgi:hypothetical protein
LGVFHKRRGSFESFFSQILSFGKTRVQLKNQFDINIKFVHLFPVFFFFFIISLPVSLFLAYDLFNISFTILVFYFSAIFISSTILNKSVKVGLLSIPAAFIQLFAYGMGFVKEFFSPQLSIIKS